MKFIYLFYFLILSSSFLSQESSKQEYIGVLRTESDEIISYKISFKELGNNSIEGESITDFYGKNNTKAKIKGTYDKNTNSISFYETSNLSSKSKVDVSQFCFIKIENIEIKEIKGKNIIQGSFKGFYPSGKSCTNGFIYLAKTSFSEIIKELKTVSDSLKKAESIETDRAKTVLVNNSTLSLNWVSNIIILEVWDTFDEDEDKLKIVFNDKIILDNLEIKNEKKTIEIPFTEKVGILKIIAKNEGEIPSNTVSVNIVDSKKLTPFISKLKTGESISINFKKKF